MKEIKNRVVAKWKTPNFTIQKRFILQINFSINKMRKIVYLIKPYTIIVRISSKTHICIIYQVMKIGIILCKKETYNIAFFLDSKCNYQINLHANIR